MSISSDRTNLPGLEAENEVYSVASETTPFLEHRQLRYSIIGDGDLEPEMIEDLQSKYDEYYRSQQQKLVKRRFWWFCCLGLVAIITMHLSFLPRTSLSRDFRRWYGLHLTKSDIKRNFLLYSDTENTSFSIKETIDMWLGNLTKISEAKSHSLTSTDNPELEQYVSNVFKLLGYHPHTHSYDVPQLRCPQSLALSLVADDGAVIYDARLSERGYSTPAYLSFGSSGKVTAPFAYVEEGSLLSYTRDVNGCIVIAKSNLSSVLSAAEKLQIAQHKGAVGFIIYREDLDNPAAISRDSGSLIPFWNDPSCRPSIPAIPVSYAAIQPILEASKATEERLMLHLSSNFLDEKPRKISNIVGHVKGILNDGEIIIGAGRDSLTSANVLSNHAVLFEIMEHFRRLLTLGWKPLRTIKFVSWDGSRSGLVGSQFFGDDPKAFENKHPVLCYINLDLDIVRGTNFRIESTPVFDHLIKKTAKYIPFPDKKGSRSTLFHYWNKQDGNVIQNIVSDNPDRSDAFVFQNHLSAPVINVRFDNDTGYCHNSNMFSLKHVREIDEHLNLHTLLARFVGLFTISLSEREILHSKTEPYFESILTSFEGYRDRYSDQLSKWSNKLVPSELLEKSTIYNNVKNDVDINSVRFGDLIAEFQSLLESAVETSSHFDTYSKEVQDGLIEDYPWFKGLVKLKRYAQYKIVNHKLIHLENELSLKPRHFEYIFGSPAEETWFHHLIYGEIPFSTGRSSTYYETNSRQILLWRLYDAAERSNYTETIKWIVVLHDAIFSIRYKLS
jgi:hypothetical protein